MKIPNWDLCRSMRKKDRNPLHVFIFNEEPANPRHATAFRERLSELLAWVVTQQDVKADAYICEDLSNTIRFDDGWDD